MFQNSLYLPLVRIKNTSCQIGKRTAYYRRKQKISQEELGIKVGLKAYYISEYERGLYRIDFEMLFEFAYALGVPAIKLLGFGRRGGIMKGFSDCDLK